MKFAGSSNSSSQAIPITRNTEKPRHTAMDFFRKHTSLLAIPLSVSFLIAACNREQPAPQTKEPPLPLAQVPAPRTITVRVGDEFGTAVPTDLSPYSSPKEYLAGKHFLTVEKISANVIVVSSVKAGHPSNEPEPISLRFTSGKLPRAAWEHMFGGLLFLTPEGNSCSGVSVQISSDSASITYYPLE